MSAPPETPVEFKYETKFVVLNYLGILPRFEEIGDESDQESDGRLYDAEEDNDSYGLRSQSSSISQDTQSSAESDACSRDSEECQQIRRIAAAAIAIPSPHLIAQGGNGEPQSRAFKGVGAAPPAPRSWDAGEDTLEGFKLASDDVVKDVLSTPSSRSSLASSSPPSLGSRTPSLKVSVAESPRTRRLLRKRKSKETSEEEEATKNRMSAVLSELESQFKKEMVEGGIDSSGVLCAISREALVAERISQIGDCIMQHHSYELEHAFRQVMGHGDEEGSLNYGIFKKSMKSLVKNSVPGWYHVAVMMKFTQRMAVNVLHQGSRSVAAVTDYAARYIEENLAQAIIEQGGWDAVTNVDLDKIDSDTWSDISSGNPSPQGTQSPTNAPLFTDEAGFLSPRPCKKPAKSSDQSEPAMPGLNEIMEESPVRTNVVHSTSGPDLTALQHGAGDGTLPQSGSSGSLSSAGLHLDLSTTQTDWSGGRRRVQSERVAQPELPLLDEDSPRGRSASFGAAVPLIATAATAATVAVAAAAVGAFALMKK